MEENGYSESDIFIKPESEELRDILRPKTMETFFFGIYDGLVYFLELENGMLTHSTLTSNNMYLNPNISYHLVIMDPKIWIYSDIHDIIPRAKIKISRNVYVNIYLKVTC